MNNETYTQYLRDETQNVVMYGTLAISRCVKGMPTDNYVAWMAEAMTDAELYLLKAQAEHDD